MKFSVIIPLYNKAPYIRKALESVLAQTYTDYELIIVDDGSTDGSAEIAEAILQEAIRLQGYEAKGLENSGADNQASRLSPLTSNLTSDSVPASRLSGVPENACGDLGCSSPLAFCLRLLKQPNQGVSAARNTGVAASTGDYVAFLDADDWWEPTYLERMAQLINDYPDAGLYASNYVYYKPGKTHVALNIPTGYINYPKAYYESDAMPVWTGAAMNPRHVYDEMGGFPLGIKLGEDFLLWSKIALHYPVAFLNEPLAYYNNDVPVNLRATRNLHHPNNHMLFQMKLTFGGGEILNQQHQQQKLTTIPLATTQRAAGEREMPTCQDWNRLIDKLRVGGLLEYWMSKEYHNLAKNELAKVDWNQQPNNVKRMYKTPIWLLKLKRWVMQVGSIVKQRLIRLIKFKLI